MGEQIRLNLTVTLGEEENVYSEKKKRKEKVYSDWDQAEPEKNMLKI